MRRLPNPIALLRSKADVQSILVDGMQLLFADDWAVSKYDEWTYYKSHFIKIKDGVKAVDIVAVDPEDVLYLIEVKDYRGRTREKTMPIEIEFQEKVFCTLAALIPAKCNAVDLHEAHVAGRAAAARSVRLFFQLDEDPSANKLDPQSTRRAQFSQILRRRLGAIDATLRVYSSDALNGVPWQVV